MRHRSTVCHLIDVAAQGGLVHLACRTVEVSGNFVILCAGGKFVTGFLEIFDGALIREGLVADFNKVGFVVFVRFFDVFGDIWAIITAVLVNQNKRRGDAAGNH